MSEETRELSKMVDRVLLDLQGVVGSDLDPDAISPPVGVEMTGEGLAFYLRLFFKGRRAIVTQTWSEAEVLTGAYRDGLPLIQARADELRMQARNLSGMRVRSVLPKDRGEELTPSPAEASRFAKMYHEAWDAQLMGGVPGLLTWERGLSEADREYWQANRDAMGLPYREPKSYRPPQGVLRDVWGAK